MIKLRGYWGSFLGIAIRFLALLVLYAGLRVGFYWFNITHFAPIATRDFYLMMWGGVRFDIVALLYLNVIYILLSAAPLTLKYRPNYRLALKWIFVVSNSIGVAVNIIDYAYYPFTLKRTTGTIFSQFSHEENLFRLSVDFLVDYWYLFILFLAILWLLVKIYDIVDVIKPRRLSWRFYVFQSSGLLLVAFLFVGGVRGGWAHSTRPITLSNAGDYVRTPEEMSIVLNTPFSILKTLSAVNLQEVHYFSPEELQSIYPVIHQPQDSAEFQKLNVVILIMESFGKEHIGFFNSDLEQGTYRGYTPFLDSLIAESYSFTRSFANGRKSIDALPSIITGIPSISEPFVLSTYSGNRTAGLAQLLGDKGYTTSFFHGAPNGSMGFSAFMQLAGVHRYYGKNEYNNNADFDGIWGIWDEPFMQFMADELEQMPEPFFTSFFSLSSHHPFKVPRAYENQFPKGTLPLHEPLGYSDYALKKFFERVSKMDWYDETLFVICADHASMTHYPIYNTIPNSFAIPIVFYYPGGDLKGVSDRLVQQIDIMPTVLNYLNYDQPYFAFGFDAFDETQKNFLVNHIGSNYNFFMGEHFMVYDDEEVKSLFNIRRDSLLQRDIKDQMPEVRDSLVKYMRAFIQQYNTRMIHNQLSVGHRDNTESNR